MWSEVAGIGDSGRVGIRRFGYRFPVIIDGGGLVREGEEATPSRSVLGTSPEEVGGARKSQVGSIGNRGYLRSVQVTFGKKNREWVLPGVRALGACKSRAVRFESHD